MNKSPEVKKPHRFAKVCALGSLALASFLATDAVAHEFGTTDFAVTEATAADFAATSDFATAPGCAERDMRIVYFPGVVSDVTPQNPSWDTYINYLTKQATDGVDILHYDTGSKFDIDDIVPGIAALLHQDLAQHASVTLVATSMGGQVAAQALADGDFSEDELARMQLILDDAPSGSNTIKTPGSWAFHVYYPGPMQSWLLAKPFGDSAFPGQPAKLYPFEAFADQVRFIMQGIPNSAALNGIAKVYYLQGNPSKDKVVVQPAAAQAWEEVLPNMVVVKVDAGHAGFPTDRANYATAFDWVFAGVCAAP